MRNNTFFWEKFPPTIPSQLCICKIFIDDNAAQEEISGENVHEGTSIDDWGNTVQWRSATKSNVEKCLNYWKNLWTSSQKKKCALEAVHRFSTE